jgi:hypothetical protein
VSAPGLPQIQHVVLAASTARRMRFHGRPLSPGLRAISVGTALDMTAVDCTSYPIVGGGIGRGLR